MDLGKYAEAEPLLQRACALAEHMDGISQQDHDMLLCQLGAVYMAQEKWEQVEMLLLPLAPAREGDQTSEESTSLEALHQLVVACMAQEKWEQAETLVLCLLPLHQKTDGETSQQTIQCMEHLVFLYYKQDKHQEAAAIVQQVQQIREHQAASPNGPETVMGLSSLASAALMQRDFESAEQLFQKALEICSMLPEMGDLSQAMLLQTLGVAQAGRKDYPRATSSLQQSLRIWEQELGPEHPDIRSIREQYQVLLASLHSGFSE
jgi:tetratricopeptide (TPR) repeat protein